MYKYLMTNLFIFIYSIQKSIYRSSSNWYRCRQRI